MFLILHVIFKLHVLGTNVQTIQRVHPSATLNTRASVATIHSASTVLHVSQTHNYYPCILTSIIIGNLMVVLNLDPNKRCSAHLLYVIVHKTCGVMYWKKKLAPNWLLGIWAELLIGCSESELSSRLAVQNLG